MTRQSLMSDLKQRSKSIIRTVAPLSARKLLCILLNRQPWLNEDLRYWWIMELLRDFAEKDVNEFHRFLWSHHLAYAASYEADSRFGEANMKESRKLFFAELGKCIQKRGLDPGTDIKSVFEVGCSLGYQLRHMETNLFPEAAELAGIDIDARAIVEGSGYLRRCKSKIHLLCSDMTGLEAILKGKMYDVIVCTGVLMYLKREEATRVVREMLCHARLVALSGPANPEADNRFLAHTAVRKRDSAFIHNLDSMIEEAGGGVLARRWEGNRVVDGHTIYFVFGARRREQAHSAGKQCRHETRHYN